MPIYEFRCSDCSELFELLVVKQGEEVELTCPKCQSENFERVLSTTNFNMGSGGGNPSGGVRGQTRNCPGGSCTTYDIPGHTR